MAAEEVWVQASLPQDQLQLGSELLLVDELIPPVGEGGGIWCSRDPLLK